MNKLLLSFFLIPLLRCMFLSLFVLSSFLSNDCAIFFLSSYSTHGIIYKYESFLFVSGFFSPFLPFLFPTSRGFPFEKTKPKKYYLSIPALVLFFCYCSTFYTSTLLLVGFFPGKNGFLTIFYLLFLSLCVYFAAALHEVEHKGSKIDVGGKKEVPAPFPL